MSKKQFAIICILLLVIIVMLFYISNQNNQLMKDLYNAGNYLSEKIDVLTGKINIIQ